MASRCMGSDIKGEEADQSLSVTAEGRRSDVKVNEAASVENHEEELSSKSRASLFVEFS